MKTADIRKKKPEEIEKLIAKSRAELARVRREQQTAETRDSARAKQLRRTIARALTIKNEQPAAEEKES